MKIYFRIFWNMDVANGMESQFANFMLTELDKSSLNKEKDSFSTKYYKSLLNVERAKIMAASSESVGLKDIILDQILHLNELSP